MRLQHKIKIHCWGGFGSQLMALALLLDLKRQYPKKTFKLVFHSSGVTRRLLEIRLFLTGIDFSEIDDFKSHSTTEVRRFFWQAFIKELLKLFHVVLEDPGTSSLPELYPWTLSIRGHYSYRPINENTVQIIALKLEKERDTLDVPDALIHYRLGDLRGLKSKSAIEPSKLFNLLLEICEPLEMTKNVVIATEDPDLAESLIPNKLGIKITYRNYNPVELIAIGIKSNYFIGTNSKLSLWIALFRSYNLSLNKTYLPESLARNLSILTSFRDFKGLESYKV